MRLIILAALLLVTLAHPARSQPTCVDVVNDNGTECINPRFSSCAGSALTYHDCVRGIVATWPREVGARIARAHDRYCRTVEAATGPFNLDGRTTCGQHQLSFIPHMCDEDGRSRISPGQSCVPELERDLEVWLDDVRPIPPSRAVAGAATARPGPSSGVSSLVAPRTAPQSIDAMPASLGLRDISARELFAAVRSSVWVLRALTRRGGVSQGSAVAVSARHLLTTCHVVADTATGEISQGTTKISVSVVVRDDRSDRCVLAVADPTLVPVRAVRPFGQLDVGERVYTVGAPAGLELTLGDGLVSSLHPRGNVSIIQTSAPMSPGSSGGALFDARGNLIGIVAFGLRNGLMLGFALAADGFWSIR